MYAIVEIAGFQEKVEEGRTVRIAHRPDDKGTKLSFPQVLLFADGSDIRLGLPFISGAMVEGEVIGHGKEDKIRVVKAHRRKRYRRVHGHRQQYTDVKVTKIRLS